MTKRFDVDRHEPRDIATEFEKRFSVGSYLAYQGDRFVGRFDANSYVTISLAMDHFDMGETHEERVRALEPARCDWLVLSFSSDWLFPPIQSRKLVDAMASLNQSVSYCEIQSEGGHDAFLLPKDIAQYGPLLRAKLGERRPSRPRRRIEDDRILERIPPGSSVLDLGCGEGDLLARLRARGGARLVGIDVSTSLIAATMQHGVDAIDFDLNVGLPAFHDETFDYVVLSSTLQVVPNVKQLLREALRVGRRAILMFPNFAYEALRTMFTVEGRVPKAPGQFGFDWYDTPNRRFPSIRDVLDLCESMGVAVEEARYYDDRKGVTIAETDDPNLKADTAVLILSPGDERSASRRA